MSSTEIVNNGRIEEPYLIGVMACCMLYGISLAQTGYYYRTYPKDHKYLKIIVGILTVLETAHLILVAETAHFVYVVCKPPENLNGLFIFRRTWTVSFALTVIITSLVQGFYCWRIWKISRNSPLRIPITTLIVVTSVGQLCIGLTLTVRFFINTFIPTIYDQPARGLYNTLLALVVFCDTLITVTLVGLLGKSKSGFKASGYAIDRLILYSVNVGLITTAISICIFVTYHSSVTSNIFSGFTAVISKIYVNSLLVTLNAREGIRKLMRTKATNNTYPLTDISFRNAAEERPQLTDASTYYHEAESVKANELSNSTSSTGDTKSPAPNL